MASHHPSLIDHLLLRAHPGTRCFVSASMAYQKLHDNDPTSQEDMEPCTLRSLYAAIKTAVTGFFQRKHKTSEPQHSRRNRSNICDKSRLPEEYTSPPSEMISRRAEERKEKSLLLKREESDRRVLLDPEEGEKEVEEQEQEQEQELEARKGPTPREENTSSARCKECAKCQERKAKICAATEKSMRGRSSAVLMQQLVGKS